MEYRRVPDSLTQQGTFRILGIKPIEIYSSADDLPPNLNTGPVLILITN
jgi:hypothetical protein